MLSKDATLLQILRQHAEAEPNATAIHFRQASATAEISRAQLLSGAARFANLLKASGVTQGEVVVIILRHSPDLLHAFLGAMMIGAIPSFMPVLTSKQEPERYWSSHRHLFHRIGKGVLLLSASNLEQARAALPDIPLRMLLAEDAAGQEPICRHHEPAPQDIALLQHSSGTTGLKKGVALTHKAIIAQVQSYAACLKLGSGDVIASWLPLYHDMGLIACFLLPLLTGTPVVMLDPFEWVTNPVLLFSAIQAHRATLCWMPNFAFQHLCRTVRAGSTLDLSSMRAWINCSEPCRAETFDAFVRCFGKASVKPEQLQVCYAMAETVFAVTQTPLGEAATRLRQTHAGHHAEALSAGRTIPGISIRIRDESGEAVPEGRIGEICISGDFLFSGYFHLEEESRKRLRDGWYHSGDLGFVHEGQLYVTGRKNDLIIVHGRNFFAHEIEFIVNQIPGVHAGRNVAVGWFKPEVGSEEVVIIAELAEASDPPAAQHSLKQTIKQTLLDSAGLLVYDVHLVPGGWLAKTTSGKISRKDNLDKYLAEIGIHPSPPPCP